MIQELLTSLSENDDLNLQKDQQITTSVSSSSTFSCYCDSITKYREWNCNVITNEELLPSEFLAITGNCDELGNWKPNLCFLMHHQKGTNQWSARIQIPSNRVIEYRYFVCMIDSNKNSVVVRRWETHLQPRTLQNNNEGGDGGEGKILESFDILGNINDLQSIHRGWLINETILQLKIYNTPFHWQDNNKSFKDIHIKITPMNMEKGGIRPIFIPIESSSKAIVEYVKFEYGNSFLRSQSQEFGIKWLEGDIIIFHITVSDLQNVAYLIEIYGFENYDYNNKNDNKFPKHLGFYYLLPELFKRSDGELKLPITNSLTHQKLANLNLSYLIIKPIVSLNLNMNLRNTSTTLWKSEWTGLDVGHRGSGVSFRISSTDILYPENTIASLKTAAKNGADMIELDVHITKDGIPIVYHDFHVNISQYTTSQPRYGSDLIPVLIKDLTYHELKNLKTYHLLDGLIRKTPSYENNIDSNEYNLFPKLEDVFSKIDKHIGIDIEIKWPQQLIDGTWESQQTIDKNLYVDNILNTILLKGYGRCIILSCFDADICTMLRFKQNIYPVLFLTLGPTKRYPLYMDPRCNSIKMATCLVQAMEFLGIIPHTEDILNDPTQINLCKNLKQIVFCWGDDSDCIEIIDKLKQMGLDGIIYDRIDKIVDRKNRRKIFVHNQNCYDNNDGKCNCSNFFEKYQFIENINNDENIDHKME